MSDTPRTDAVCFSSDIGGMVVNVEFARSLERENAAMREELDEIYALYLAMCSNLQTCVQKYKIGLDGEKLDRLVVSEIAAMREAIREAHDAIVLSPYPDADALAKLRPFLKP